MDEPARRLRVYLAGPEVFLPNANEVGAAKVAMCARVGLTGLFPLDQSLDVVHLAPQDQAHAIARANEDLMRSADALVANLTPFRGVSMDCGTAYEIGFMRSLGRPVFGYTTSGEDYRARVDSFRRHGGAWCDGDRADYAVEDFGLSENLMIDMAVRSSGVPPIRDGRTPPDISDLSAFGTCLEQVVAALKRSGSPQT